MIENELILLGLLKEGPKNGYEIKKQIKGILYLFAGLDLKSVYYPLEVLEKQELVLKHIDAQYKLKKRFVFELTRKGRKRFNELLRESFLNFKRPQFSLDLSLYFLKDIRPKTAKRRLRARMQILNNLSRSLKKMSEPLTKKALPLARILEHNLQMVITETKFLSSLINTL